MCGEGRESSSELPNEDLQERTRRRQRSTIKTDFSSFVCESARVCVCVFKFRRANLFPQGISVRGGRKKVKVDNDLIYGQTKITFQRLAAQPLITVPSLNAAGEKRHQRRQPGSGRHRVPDPKASVRAPL